jgi:hypothetical protein
MAKENDGMNILVLLLGGNPLPNFAAADYLLNPVRVDVDFLPVPQKIIFLSTVHTEKFYQPILDLLGERHDRESPRVEQLRLMTELRNPAAVRETIKSIFDNHPVIDTLHLNYTGGTKTMAVNSFSAAAGFIGDREFHLILSDLDPLNFKLRTLRFEASGDVENFPGAGDVREYVHLDIPDIFELHGMTLLHDACENDDPLLDGGADDAIASGRGLSEKFKEDKPRKRFMEIYRELKESEGQVSIEIINEFPFLDWMFDGVVLDESSRARLTFGQFYEYINGKWLEYYIYGCLERIAVEANITAVGKDVKVQYDSRRCEFDLIAVRGCQIFLFSCTTSKELRLVKQKALEALLRADRLGGEHARVVVVSTMFNEGLPGNNFSRRNNLEELEKEINSFDMGNRCSFLGVDELSDSWELMLKLRDILEGD